jgi:transmembrane sensor
MTELLKVAEPAWDEGRARAAFSGMGRLKRARRVTRAALLVCACAAIFSLWPHAEVVRFADGSTAQLLEKETALTETAHAPGLLSAQLASGRARFDVVHDPSRRFRVQAGEVAVEVLGTQFTVEKSGNRAKVAVERGRVRVSWRGGSTELGVGESGVYPPDDEVAELLRAADTARREGRPEGALLPLRRIVDEHGDDARAPLAAFTLGRLYFDELRRPAEAANAFARARSLAPDGPLAADARARETQARGLR